MAPAVPAARAAPPATAGAPTARSLPPQFPTPAQDPQGAHGRQLPTLQDEYRRLVLEQAVDKVLEDIQREKEAKKK